MKIFDTISDEEKEKLLSINGDEQHKGETKLLIAKVAIISLICITLLITSELLIIKREAISGNPYYCTDCRNLKFSCSKHKDFDAIQETHNMMETYLGKYDGIIPDDTTSKLWLYNNTYNPQCDFCKLDSTECSTCITSRKLLEETVALGVSTYELCDTCKTNNGVLCSKCKDGILLRIYN